MNIKVQLICAIISIFSVPTFAQAQPKNFNNIIAKAEPQELRDLPKLLKQIKMKRAGKTMMLVTAVEKGSVYDREGIKAGDLIDIGKALPTDEQKK